MKALFIPIYSMRSYATGKYAILKDGNFQLTMARVLASNFNQIFVTVPDDASDFAETLKRFESFKNVFFIKARYGANAVESRQLFWIENDKLIQSFEQAVDVVISDITDYAGPKSVIFNFNITKLPELDRPYIDRFFDRDLKSIERSLFTTVLNPRQREYILEVRPDLLSKVFVNTKCASERLLPNYYTESIDEKVIFWPFRISDKAYRWEQFLSAFVDQRLHEQGWTIITTDPNDTLKSSDWFITNRKLVKVEYYAMLQAKPIVVMLDDIDKVLHPGTIEFFHYGCPVITYPATLIDNPNTIVDLSSLSAALAALSYNPVDVSAFVYKKGELDSYYQEDVIRVTQN